MSINVLTGEDGRVSFSKLVLLVVLWFQGILLWHVVDSPALVDAFWPLVWMFALTVAASHGLKGLQLWFSAARLRTEARSEVSRLVEERRDHSLGIDPS